MKKFWLIVGIFAAVIIIVAVFCCIFACKWQDNFVSMLSGIWSAIATIVLGIIAVWQNKRYKEESDKLDERQNAPEFFISSPSTTKGGWQSDLVITAHGTKEGGLKTETNCMVWLCSIDKPILHLKPTKITIADVEDKLTMDGETEINVYKPYTVFGLKFDKLNIDKEGKQHEVIEIEYENIYGIRYHKHLSREITIVNGKIRQFTWGKLSKAEKID